MDTEQQGKNQKIISAEGYVFFSEKDAELAKTERKKADYLESHMDYTRPETILKIYRRTIEERIFKTPVGIGYLKKLQDYLLTEGHFKEDQIPPIPLYQYFDKEVRTQTAPAKRRVVQSPPKPEKKNSVLPVSIMLNIMLVIAILAMFVISFNADQPNVFNYERALQDRYSTWEQQLMEREQTVREKELELHISE